MARLVVTGMAMLMVTLSAQAWRFTPKVANQRLVPNRATITSSHPNTVSPTISQTVLQLQLGSADGDVGVLPERLANVRLLFVLEQGVGKARTSRLVLTSFNTRDAKVLTEVTGAIFNLSVSKDGRSVVYTEQQQSFPQLWRLDIVTGHKTLLSHQRANYFSGSLSPDKQQLVFAASLGDNPEIFLADADGGQVRQLTHAPAIDIAPQWLPNQQGVIFASDRQGLYHPQIYRYDFDRQQLKRLTQGNYFANPKVSPDGQWLSYLSKDGQGNITRLIQHLATSTVMPIGDAKLAESMTFSTGGEWGVYSQGDRIRVVDMAKIAPGMGAINRPADARAALDNFLTDKPMIGSYTIGQLLPSLAVSNAIIREPQLIEP